MATTDNPVTPKLEKVRLRLVGGCGSCSDETTGFRWELDAVRAVSREDADRLLKDPAAQFEEVAA